MKWIWMAIAFCVVLLVITLSVKVWTADLNYQTTASIQIDAPAADVFRKVGNLSNWPEWSPFIPANAPNVQIDQQSDAPTMTWMDPRGGESTLSLDRLDAIGGEIQHTLNSKIFPPMTGSFSIKDVDASDDENGENLVSVTWQVEGELPNSFFYALAAGNYGEMLKPQLQSSLERLKTVCEKEKVSPASSSDGKTENEVSEATSEGQTTAETTSDSTTAEDSARINN